MTTDTVSGPHTRDQAFRRGYGALVGSLVRRVGVEHLATIEDAVQTAWARALEAWPVHGAPDNPDAWLFRVAHNAVLETLRTNTRRDKLLRAQPDASDASQEGGAARLSAELQDDLLRMLFVCCDDAVPTASQLVLGLKVLCGFDVATLSARLFTSEANVYKRLERARTLLRKHAHIHDALDPSQYEARLPTVHRLLYVMFTEGYLSVQPDQSIRQTLCDEALRLASLLAAHPVGQRPETAALLALMHLQRARLPGRQDASGGLLLLAEQDRSAWDQTQIAKGLAWLAESACGEVFSRFHAEAGIAAEHCLAPSFAQTRWDRIAACYAQLEAVAPSPLHRLNRALAVAEADGPEAGLAVIQGLAPPSWLTGSYMWSAVLSDLQRRCGQHDAAEQHRRTALALAPSKAVKTLLGRRLGGAGP